MTAPAGTAARIDRRTAPLRLVVAREEPSACSIRETYTEEYECGHIEYYADPKPAKRRRCTACAKESPRAR